MIEFSELVPKSIEGAVIRKHNALIEAKYQLPSVQEQRVIFMLLAQIKLDDEDFKVYRITVADFAQIIGSSSKSVYSDLERVTRALRSREIGIREGKSFLYMGWLSSVEYKHGSGYVELCFDPKLKPYLLQLKDHFTQYKLDSVLCFKSIYAIRLYEMLKKEAFKADRERKFEVEYTYLYLREAFAVGKKEYLQFNNFKRKTIEAALKEINQKTDLTIYDIIYGKTGRAVTRIFFRVQICDPAEMSEKQSTTIVPVSNKEVLIQRLQGLGYGVESARRDVNKHGIRHVERSIAYALAKQESGEIKDFPAYLTRVIADDLGGAWEKNKAAQAEKLVKTKKEEKRRASTAQKEEAKLLAAHEALLEDFFAFEAAHRAEIVQAFLSQLPNPIRRTADKVIKVQGESALRQHQATRALFIAFLKQNQDQIPR